MCCVCFSSFQIIDCFAGVILQLIPFYSLLRYVFLIWLMHPKTMGATTVYNSFISSYIQKYRSQIEKLEQSIKQGNPMSN